MIGGRLALELSYVALKDEDAIVQPYAYPPRAPLTPEEVDEVKRLHAISARLYYRATALGWGSTGLDAALDDSVGPVLP